MRFGRKREGMRAVVLATVICMALVIEAKANCTAQQKVDAASSQASSGAVNPALRGHKKPCSSTPIAPRPSVVNVSPIGAYSAQRLCA